MILFRKLWAGKLESARLGVFRLAGAGAGGLRERDEDRNINTGFDLLKFWKDKVIPRKIKEKGVVLEPALWRILAMLARVYHSIVGANSQAERNGFPASSHNRWFMW